MSKEKNTHGDLGKELAAWTERDLTQAARDGELPRAHGREALLERIQQILATGQSAVLTGEPGVGKSALVYELVRRWSAGDGPGSLSHRRVLQISLRRRASARCCSTSSKSAPPRSTTAFSSSSTRGSSSTARARRSPAAR